MQIVIDTREQLPYTFRAINPPPDTIRKALASGDYSIEGFEDQIAIERKSKVDFYGSVGRGRRRFEAELERLSKFEYAAVVIEAEWRDLLIPPARSRLNKKTITRGIAAWNQRYGVSFYTVPNRAFAERWTYILLERFWRDHDA